MLVIIRFDQITDLLARYFSLFIIFLHWSKAQDVEKVEKEEATFHIYKK